MKSFFLAALVCVVLVFTQGEVQAQITWSPGVGLFEGGDNTDFISQNGTFVLGIAPGGVSDVAGGVVATVGTAEFLNTGQTANSTLTEPLTSTQNGVTFTGEFIRVQTPTFESGEFLDPVVQSLITPATWNYAYDPEVPTVTFSGLTEGDTYEIQVIVSDARNGRSVNFQQAFTNGSDDLVATVATMSNRELDDEVLLNSAGDFVIGTFVADASGIQTFSCSATIGVNQPQDQFIVGESIDITANDPPGTPRAGTTQINALQLRNISDGGPDVLLGDPNCDGLVDFRDIVPFILMEVELSISGTSFHSSRS